MIVVPLIASSLVIGVAGIGDVRRLGPGGRCVRSLYCFVISAISVVIGLTLANTIRPGERVSPADGRGAGRSGTARTRSGACRRSRPSAPAPAESPLMQVVKTIVPANPLYAVSAFETPQMLQLMFVALIVGVAVTLVPADVRGAACCGSWRASTR